MSIKAQLSADVVKHLKAGEKLALTTVRNLLGEISREEKKAETATEFTDEQILALMRQQAAKRRAVAPDYLKAGKAEQAAAEIAEAEIIEAYLPDARLTASEVEAIIGEVIQELKDAGTEPSIRSIGDIMKPVIAKVDGRYDGKSINALVRAALS